MTRRDRLELRASALSSARAQLTGPSYQGAKPLPAAMGDHPAVSAAPTETYPNPEDTGGWLYVIEPEDETWIAFIGVDGKALLWTKRDESGGVIGIPYLFTRKDLAVDGAVPSKTALAAVTMLYSEEQDRDDHGRFGGGGGGIGGAKNDRHVRDVGAGKFSNGNSAHENKIHWAHTKAVESGKVVYAKKSDEPHSAGLKLQSKAPKRGEFHAIHPDGRIVHHKLSAELEDTEALDALEVQYREETPMADTTTTSASDEPMTMLSAVVDHALFVALAVDPVTKQPPKELRLFRAGVNPSLKGPFTFDAKCAAMVMANYKAMGHRLAIDYDHASLNQNPIDPARSKISAGTFELEVRGGDLWAINIQWTEAAAAAIRREEWPFISPAFKNDDKGRVGLLLNFALTINPALYSPAEVVAASAMAFHGYPLKDDDSWDADAATHRLRKWASSDGSGDSATMDWKRYGEGFAAQRAPSLAGPKFGDFLFPHHDVDAHGNLLTSKKGVQTAAQFLTKVKDLDPADLAAVKTHLGQHYSQWGAKAPWDRQENTAMAMKYSQLPDAMKKNGFSKKQMMKALGVDSPEELDALMGTDDPMAAQHQKGYDDLIKGLMTTSTEPTPDSEKAAQLAAAAKKAKQATLSAEASESPLASLDALSITISGKRGLDYDGILARSAELNALEKRLVVTLNATGVDDAFVLLRRLAATSDDLCMMTGEKTPAASMAALDTVWKKRSEIEVNLTKARTDRVTQMLSVAVAEKRVKPAELEGAYGLRAMGIKDPAMLEAQLKLREPAVQASIIENAGEQPANHEPPPPAQQVTKLNGLDVSKGKPATLHGKTYEQLSSNEKVELRNGSDSEKAAFDVLHGNWIARGKPAVTLGAN